MDDQQQDKKPSCAPVTLNDVAKAWETAAYDQRAAQGSEHQSFPRAIDISEAYHKQVKEDPIRTPRLLLLAAICAVPESKTRPVGQVDLQALVDAIWAHERLSLPITVDLEVKALAYCYGKDVVVMGTRMEVAAGAWTSEQQGFVKAAWANLQALRALRPRW